MSPTAGAAAPLDPYATLQVTASADPEVIEAAYRALARRYHPDVNRAPTADQRMQQINAAYAVLRDPGRRAAYDRQRLAGRAGPDLATEAVRAARLQPARPVDLLLAVLREQWARLRTAIEPADVTPGVEAGVNRPVRLGGGRPALAAGTGRLALILLAAVAGIALAAGVLAVTGGERRTTVAYWQAAATTRARVELSRERYYAVLGGDAGYSAAAGNPAFMSVTTQLAADLSAAIHQFRSVGRVPRGAEAYHLAQLDDWQVERELRVAFRDAAVARNADLWAQTALREAAWLASAAHWLAESRAWALAARLGAGC